MELLELTALELGRAIRAGETTIPAATQAALEVISRENPQNNAYITVLTEVAMARAEALQKALTPDAPALYGVPMALKDNLCTKDVKTTCASKIMGDFTPPYESTASQRLLDAGAVLLGKLNMDEFAMGSTTETSFYGPVRNPRDLTRVPGGSSGGAAAAVAAKMGWYALGSDTGGSIRQPGSYCGVTGMKPTYGAVSRCGLIAYASSLDQIGPLARDARDCAAILDVIAGQDKRDSTSVAGPYGDVLAQLDGDVWGLRIGLPRECFGEGLDSEVEQAVREMAKALEARGATVEEFSLPIMDYVVPAYYILASAEASSNLSRFDGVKYGWRAEDYEDLTDLYNKTRTQGFGREVKRRILLGTFVLSSGYFDAYYKKALQVKSVIARAYKDAFAKYDLILTPVAPTTAPKLGESLHDPLKMYLSDIYTVPVNLSGLPGISVPCGTDSQGLPIGGQLIGPAMGDALVLKAADAYQQEVRA